MQQTDGIPPHIVVVDDDPVARVLAEACLDHRGMEVVACESAHEARDAIDARIPDVVVSDVMMPGISGLDLCVMLRSDPRTQDIPLLLLTASGDREARIRALELGADDLLAKPFDGEELAARVHSLIRLSRMRAAVAGDRQLDATLGTFSEGVVVVDPDGSIVRANAAGAELLGLGPDVLGRDLDEILAARSRLGEHEPIRPGTTLRALTVNGHEILLRVTVTSLVVTDGAVRRVVTLHDVTDEQRGQDLGDLVLSLVTHKLLTPLTGIRGAAELLMRGDGPAPRQVVELLERNAHRLHTTVERILDVAAAALQDGSLTLSADADIAAMVGEGALHEVRDEILGRAHVDLPEAVEVSRTAFVTAMRELVDNAIAVTTPGGVEVRISPHDDLVSLEVIDDGPGLPPGAAQKIFVPFFQGDRTGQSNGMGLGLTLVRSAVTSAGGTVRATSSEAGGAVFVVTLPARRVATPPAAVPADALPPLTRTSSP